MYEASTPMLDMRRECHLKNLMYKRKDMPNYVHIPNRQLRLYEAPVLIEYQSQNATFERSILFKGAQIWNLLPVEVRNSRNIDIFKGYIVKR